MPSIRRALTLIPLISLAGCASQSQSQTAYVSPHQYDDYTCSQMQAEMKRLSSQIDQLQKKDMGSQLMNTALSVYAVSQGYGVGEDDENPELMRAKAKYALVDEILVKKNCTN